MIETPATAIKGETSLLRSKDDDDSSLLLLEDNLDTRIVSATIATKTHLQMKSKCN